LSRAAPGAVNRRVQMAPDGIHGRVVDRWGRPVEGATVEFVLPFRVSSVWAGAPEPRPARWLATEPPTHVTHTDGEGRFTLALQRGWNTSVVAWDPELGTAQCTGVRGDEPRNLGVLRLEERGVIAGRIVYPDGRPVRFLKYQLVSHVIEPPGELSLPFVEAIHRTRHGGVLRVAGRTDAEGRFRGVGLTPGEYSLDYGIWSTSHGSWRNSHQPISTGDKFVRAELDGARILVRVEDAQGRSCTGSRVCRVVALPDGWTAWERRSLFTLADFELFDTDSPTVALETGLAEFWAVRGTTYLLGAKRGEHESEILRVAFPLNLHELEVALELPLR
ncbi:MAG: hypothetical protein V3T22_12745, partial [Planctomycetota bacterium]